MPREALQLCVPLAVSWPGMPPGTWHWPSHELVDGQGGEIVTVGTLAWLPGCAADTDGNRCDLALGPGASS